MPQIHTVVQGECLSSIAKRYGLANWRRIYDDPNNAEIRRKRPNPNTIYPGDQWFIPDPKRREQSCATDRRHRFMCHRKKTMLEIVVEDRVGHPLSDKPYRLKVGAKVYEGTTGPEGRLRCEIEPDEESGELTVFAGGGGYSWQVALGSLDPLEQATGIQGRLRNLGYYDGGLTGELDPATVEALKRFQADHELAISGEPDEPTRAALRQAHDKE